MLLTYSKLISGEWFLLMVVSKCHRQTKKKGEYYYECVSQRLNETHIQWTPRTVTTTTTIKESFQRLDRRLNNENSRTHTRSKTHNQIIDSTENAVMSEKKKQMSGMIMAEVIEFCDT